ncbi:TetR/AcrR family transcriptional regulator [Actinoplanes sp. NPDC026619]|uniref:TetR/AcrR family transcriptional regulator n=1 Tax=Actinoplanes sp. NPDC026619 TaxID=3155798 RepID=UPI00340D5433
MSIRERRERERAERERLIIGTARELAEAEGWDAVTTRRLAEQIEYSQPVLYSHFKGKDAIMAAVAVEGFAELATELRAARTGAPTPQASLAAVAAAYALFAETRPVLYEAMFTNTVALTFASPETPAALQEGFGELREALRPLAGNDDLEARTEVFWAGLHGLMTLTRSGRLRPEDHERRLALLLHSFNG